MSGLFRFSSAVAHDPAVEAWFSHGDDVLRRLAKSWFEVMRACGDDVRELIHDGWPTACAEDAAFAYVAAFQAHVNVGFYNGAALADPAGLLEGAGKRMRHVKLRWGEAIDEAALTALIAAAYSDVRRRLQDEA
ncbi:DUF1801 domain-containing protein [Phenylobacterium sp.]|uniref:DUF1801 domain-containing protein n=1 Tax=Phenylobacterium sp. TaxID=1871053 RepID=UPI0026336CAA|nr:DUF1801 domain-containing protein [Phenylobacterium sp.]